MTVLSALPKPVCMVDSFCIGFGRLSDLKKSRDKPITNLPIKLRNQDYVHIILLYATIDNNHYIVKYKFYYTNRLNLLK